MSPLEIPFVWVNMEEIIFFLSLGANLSKETPLRLLSSPFEHLVLGGVDLIGPKNSFSCSFSDELTSHYKMYEYLVPAA